MASNPSKVSYEPITSTLRRKQEDMSAVVIQRSFRRYLARLALKKAAELCKEQPKSSVMYELEDNEVLVIGQLADNSTSTEKTDMTPSTASLPSYNSATNLEKDQYEKEKREKDKDLREQNK